MLDGDRLWRSDKLKQVKPESFRAEYANMLPLALANGTFECSPEKIWFEVYAFNRESFKPSKIAKILDEFERAKLLFRWVAGDGKVWGYWTGIEKTLPTDEQIKQSRYKTGQPVPKQQLTDFISSATCNNVEQQVARTWIGLDRNELEGVEEDNVNIKNALTDKAREILGVRIGPQDSNWPEIKSLVRVYGDDAVAGKFEQWAKSQTQIPNYPLSGFIRIADGLLSGKFSSSVSPEELSSLVNDLVIVSDGRVIFNNNQKQAIAGLLVDNSPADIKSAFQEFWGNIENDDFSVRQAAKTFTEAAEQLLAVQSRRREKEARTQELLRASTEAEQKKAASELAARMKEESDLQDLIEDTI